MSLTSALNNASSGLLASSRGTETVSSNLANALTPGYARRDVSLASQSGAPGLGGVRVLGITRAVNETLIAENRDLVAAQAGLATGTDFARKMEELIGSPGTQGALADNLNDLKTSLESAISRPDSEVRLTQVIDDAKVLATQINKIGQGIQDARLRADQDIKAQVGQFNSGLSRLAALNDTMVSYSGTSADLSSLRDERQSILDQIGKIIPLKVVDREGGRIAVFSAGGMVLLNGTRPETLSFNTTDPISPDMSADAGDLSPLFYGDRALISQQRTMFGGGSLGAAFAVRDDLAPAAQVEIDSIAVSLLDRFSGPPVDPTLSPGQRGLFVAPPTGGGSDTGVGVSQRLNLNPAIDPSQGGSAWRLRAGVNAPDPGIVGSSTTLEKMVSALVVSGPSSLPGSGPQNSVINMVSELESRVASRRVTSESNLTVATAQLETVKSKILDDAVDSDVEMQRLLQFEQLYVANARVIQVIDQMFESILRI